MGTDRKLSDWLLLGLLVLIFGLSFVWLKVTVASIPALTTAAGRTGLGFCVLFIVMRLKHTPWPKLFIPLKDRPERRLNPIWRTLVVISLIGLAVPQTLIAWGQQYVDSGLAGILLAFMPLSTVFLAALFIPGERLTIPRLTGFTLGFIGICVLIGPDALRHLGDSREALLGQMAIVGGAICYGAGGVIVQRMAPINPIAAGALQTLFSTVMLAPVALVVDTPWSLSPNVSSLIALAGLGIISTGLFTYLFFVLVRSAGAAFMAQTSYLGPPVAVVMGALFLAERPGANAVIALALILLGVALAQTKLGIRLYTLARRRLS